MDLDELKAAVAHGHNVVLELDFAERPPRRGQGDKTKAASLRGGQGDSSSIPSSGTLLHVDLHEVDLAVEIEAPVAIELVGTPAGVADGGILDWEHREVTVRALPGNMPGVLELDVSGLQIGHHLTVGGPEGPRRASPSSTIPRPCSSLSCRRGSSRPRRGASRPRWPRSPRSSAKPRRAEE